MSLPVAAADLRAGCESPAKCSELSLVCDEETDPLSLRHRKRNPRHQQLSPAQMKLHLQKIAFITGFVLVCLRLCNVTRRLIGSVGTCLGRYGLQQTGQKTGVLRQTEKMEERLPSGDAHSA